jgi:hypothetical protein
MKRVLLVTGVALVTAVVLTGCQDKSQTEKDKEQVANQQAQYSASQPVPAYDWSLERHLMIELYNTRNMKAVTHSVWRSNSGVVEGDCPSMGFGMPYDTSLTNPLKGQYYRNGGTVVVEQAEPNGIFASKNTQATWVMCTNKFGSIEPVYVESKVTAYPYPVSTDYKTNRVTKAGKSTVTISAN